MPGHGIRVLTVAGLDPSGGAGLLADVKTFENFGVMGFGVATAITWQNEDEFDGLKWMEWDELDRQLAPLLRKHTIAATKVGLIDGMDTLIRLCLHLKRHNPEMRIVWDPVMSASAGFSFHEKLDREKLGKALPLLDLVTPNMEEAEMLMNFLGFEGGLRDFMRNAAKKYGTDFLFKSEMLNGDKVSDLLSQQDGTEIRISSIPLHDMGKHGTGCVLSAGIAAGLAKGMNMETSCRRAAIYVNGLMRSAQGRLGRHFVIDESHKKA